MAIFLYLNIGIVTTNFFDENGNYVPRENFDFTALKIESLTKLKVLELLDTKEGFKDYIISVILDEYKYNFIYALNTSIQDELDRYFEKVIGGKSE